LELESTVTVGVDLDRVKARAALITTIGGRRAKLIVKGVCRFVLTRFADGVRVVIFEGSCGTWLTERPTVATETLRALNDTSLTIMTLQIVLIVDIEVA
jgi:hypothetical protein